MSLFGLIFCILQEHAIVKPHESTYVFYPRQNGGCDEATIDLELVARSRPSSSHFTLSLSESGSSLSSLSGVWANRAGVLGTAPNQDDAEQTIVASRRSSTPTPPIEHPRTPHPLSSDNCKVYKGQPLMGQWANASVGVSGAAVLKRSLTQPPGSPAFNPQRSMPTYFPSPSSSRSSSRSGTPIPADDSIDGKGRRGSGGKEWTPVRNDRKGSGGGKGRGRDDRSSTGYNRSVSDTREFRRGGKQQRGGHKQSFSSEPIYDHRRRN